MTFDIDDLNPTANELRRLARHAHQMHVRGRRPGVPDEVVQWGPVQEPDNDKCDETEVRP